MRCQNNSNVSRWYRVVDERRIINVISIYKDNGTITVTIEHKLAPDKFPEGKNNMVTIGRTSSNETIFVFGRIFFFVHRCETIEKLKYSRVGGHLFYSVLPKHRKSSKMKWGRRV